MKKILVIDDYADNLTLIRSIINIKLPGYEVILANSGKMGIELAMEELPEVILLDIFMPEMDGFKVCRHLKEKDKTRWIPIILISAYGHDTSLRIEGLETGADAFLSKPYDASELVAMIKVLLRIKSAEDELRNQNINLENRIKKQIEEIARDEERFIQISEYSNEFFWETDYNTVFTYISKVVRNVLGYNISEIVNKKTIYDLFHPDEGKYMNDFFKKIFREKRNLNRNKVIFQSKEGKKVWYSIHGFPVYDENNNFKGYRGVCHNITEKMMYEEKLSSVINTSLDGFWILNPSGEIISVNKSYCNMSGFSEKELIGKSYKELDCWKDTTILKNYISSSSNSVQKRFESCHKCKNGDLLPVEVSINIPGIDNKQTYVFIRDISSLKMAEKARKQHMQRINNYQKRLKDLNSKLIVAEENERKRIAEYIHDGLGQDLILTSLKLSSVLRKKLDDESLKIIKETSDLLNETINSARSLTYDLSPPILHELGLVAAIRWKLDQVYDKFNIETQVKNNTERIEVQDEIRALIYRIVCELITNVIKHASAAKIIVEIIENEDSLYIAVEDNGKGFNQEKETGASEYKGYGLFSIKESLDSINGSLIINSIINQGTKVKVLVPV